ncbi:hypothetical protein [Pseudomonas sp. DWP3-1-2]|uniref:hypothetical protein n=1 Tax=Pseudomonas sp. DWP3-1-2 TaxID=2804645 RepID=UPI003CE68CA3
MNIQTAFPATVHRGLAAATPGREPGVEDLPTDLDEARKPATDPDAFADELELEDEDDDVYLEDQ